MKNKKLIVVLASIFTITIILCIGITEIINKPQKTIEYISASWVYNYKNIEEIAKASDLIALVKVNKEEKLTFEDGIPFTEFSVDIIESIYNAENLDNFIINMTGGKTKDKIIEIIDDPLLNPNDELLVFCRKNENGTYRIISGSQGRLIYSNGKLNSLNAIDKRIAEANSYSNISVQNADAVEMIEQIKSYFAEPITIHT